MLPRVEKAYRAPATLPMVATVRVRRRIANGDTMPITAAGKKNRAAEAASGPARAPNCTADRDDSTPGAASGIRNTSPPANTKSPAKTIGEGQRSAARPPAT